MGAGKWIGGIIGFMAGGPLGALAGYALGSLIELGGNTASYTTDYGNGQTEEDVFAGQRNSFLFSMLVMASHSISGTISTLKPKAKLSAMTNVAFRLIFCAAIIRMPAEATVPNISKVAPPNTGSGIREKINPTLGNNPNKIRKPAM